MRFCFCLYILQTVTSLVSLQSLSNVGGKLVAPIFPAFFVGNTAINRPTLTRPGMDRRENGIFSPVHAPQSPFLSGISMGLIDFQFDLFLLPPKTGKSTFAGKSVWEPPLKSFMSTCAIAHSLSAPNVNFRKISVRKTI